MNDILMATRDIMRHDISNDGVNAVADIAVRSVKPLVARAGKVINGTEAEDRAAGRDVGPQTAVDALLSR